MSEPRRELQDALAQVTHHWDAERTERALQAAQHERKQRKRRRSVRLGAAGLLALVGTSWLARDAWPNGSSVQTAKPVSAPAAVNNASTTAAGDTQFEDGSIIVRLDNAARVVVDEVTPTRVVVRLLGGHVRADVAHRPERRFRVLSGDVEVEVLGTAFELQRDAARTRVSVQRGRVAVRWPGGQTELAAGEAGWFPKTASTTAAALPAVTDGVEPSEPSEAIAEPLELGGVPDAAPRAPDAVPGVRASSRRNASHLATTPDSAWRVQAELGDFSHAYELLARAPARVEDDVKELMLAADAARLSGHPAQALPFLQRVVDRHRGDPRAPLAAFTLGGVLMNQLGQPREAETAYARARSLSLSPSLAQDALARQVEAAHRAGDSVDAHALAIEYLQRYPDGRRVHAVRRFGGL